MFGAGLKENENSLSDEPEADEVDAARFASLLEAGGSTRDALVL